MAYFVSILLGAVVAATLADLALNRWGRLAMVVIFGLLAVLIWSVSLQHPLLATNYLNGRAFAFFRVRFAAYVLLGVALGTVIMSWRRVSRPLAVSLTTVLGFFIGWGGGFVT